MNGCNVGSWIITIKRVKKLFIIMLVFVLTHLWRHPFSGRMIVMMTEDENEIICLLYSYV